MAGFKSNKNSTSPNTNPNTKKSSSLNMSNEKLFETIRKRAYELYCKSGYQNGNDRNHWFEAERQVKKELGLTR